MFLRAALFAVLCLTASPAFAGEAFLYKDGDVQLEGYFARTDASVT